MIEPMLKPVIFLFNLIMSISVTGLCSLFIFLAGVIKFLIPLRPVAIVTTRFANTMMFLWASYLAFVFNVVNRTQWQINGGENLSKENWYLLISNHQSWLDIVVLSVVFRHKIPMLKFFLKQELIWVPFIGVACWALDMPFMKRYSQRYLLKHPHLKGADIESTRRACQKFKLIPTTVVNFVEGSRFTEAKRIKLNSPFRHLLKPKAAGIAFALTSLGDEFDKVLNITLVYPTSSGAPFIRLLCGDIKQVYVEIETIAIDEHLRGDYFADKSFKRQFQGWLNDLWARKDNLITEIKSAYRQ